MLDTYPLSIPPGVVTDATNYAKRGRWIDSNLIRFKNGKPEGFAGWVLATSDTLDGVPRTIYPFAALDGTKSLFFGTSRRCYVWYNVASMNDITPLVYENLAANNVIITTDTSNRVGVVLPPATTVEVGSVIIIGGSTAVGGIPDTEINGEHTVVEMIGDDAYFDVTSSATSTVAGGGGAAITVQILYPPGFSDTILTTGGGWGDPPWGFLGWGGTTDGNALLLPLRYWSVDSWGEDLIISPSDGPIYYWDETNPADRALPISTMVGASEVPVAARQVLVVNDNRIVMAFAVNPIGSIVQDPMLIRWSDNENYLEWSPVPQGSAAGEIRLIAGSVFVGAIEASNEILAWSDTALHSILITADNNIFGVRVLTPDAPVYGRKAMAVAADVVFWGGPNGFFRYAGAVQRVDCPVLDFINNNMDGARASKTVACVISEKNEIMWCFVSTGSGTDEPDAYVKYNWVENVWDIGYLRRTAWNDANIFVNPIATTYDGKVIIHEIGVDNLEDPLDPQMLERYIAHGPVEIDGKGNSFILTSWIMPDIEVIAYSSTGATLEMSIESFFRRGPGGSEYEAPQIDLAITNSPDYDRHQVQARLKGRGRSYSGRWTQRTAGYNWRLGDTRLVGRPDGRK